LSNINNDLNNNKKSIIGSINNDGHKNYYNDANNFIMNNKNLPSNNNSINELNNYNISMNQANNNISMSEQINKPLNKI
jgi:hypothetical protein